MSNDAKIQELIRILDATLAEVNPQGLSTGQNCVKIIEFLESFPGLKQFISPEFNEHLVAQLAATGGKDNVRQQVKAILTFPHKTYAPWTPVNVSSLTYDKIAEATANVTFKIAKVEGKIYAVSQTENVNWKIFHTLNVHTILVDQMCTNPEISHITLINSDVVAKLDHDKLDTILRHYATAFHVDFQHIKTTRSNDWSPFSTCMVIKIKSDLIDLFISECNATFGLDLKVSKHLTFAIKPRSLFYDPDDQ